MFRPGHKLITVLFLNHQYVLYSTDNIVISLLCGSTHSTFKPSLVSQSVYLDHSLQTLRSFSYLQIKPSPSNAHISKAN